LDSSDSILNIKWSHSGDWTQLIINLDTKDFIIEFSELSGKSSISFKEI
jgi:hypothetical protein